MSSILGVSQDCPSGRNISVEKCHSAYLGSYLHPNVLVVSIGPVVQCNGGPHPSFICIYRLALISVHLPAILLLCIIDFQPGQTFLAFKWIFVSTELTPVQSKVEIWFRPCRHDVKLSDDHSVLGG